MPLFEQLAEKFGLKQIDPFGTVVPVPSKDYMNMWTSQLDSEGVQILQGRLDGKVCFFLRKKSNQPQQSSQPEWTPELVEKLKLLRNQKLGHRAIAKQLGLKEHKVYKKLKELGLIAVGKKQKADSEPVSTVNKPTDLLGELISSLNLLYPKHKLACKVLLQNACVFMGENKNE
ncbi:hypothetical protein KEJ45_03435 [Candidatus Bathyarchaeota archaeon]|nr:hypothetical protein [Candidatus Bathyarchaeota archaeon]